jgi:hypothetical protein
MIQGAGAPKPDSLASAESAGKFDLEPGTPRARPTLHYNRHQPIEASRTPGHFTHSRSRSRIRTNSPDSTSGGGIDVRRPPPRIQTCRVSCTDEIFGTRTAARSALKCRLDQANLLHDLCLQLLQLVAVDRGTYGRYERQPTPHRLRAIPQEAMERQASRTGPPRNVHEPLAVRRPRDELRNLGDTVDGLLERLPSADDAPKRLRSQ